MDVESRCLQALRFKIKGFCIVFKHLSFVILFGNATLCSRYLCNEMWKSKVNTGH